MTKSGDVVVFNSGFNHSELAVIGQQDSSNSDRWFMPPAGEYVSERYFINLSAMQRQLFSKQEVDVQPPVHLKAPYLFSYDFSKQIMHAVRDPLTGKALCGVATRKSVYLSRDLTVGQRADLCVTCCTSVGLDAIERDAINR